MIRVLQIGMTSNPGGLESFIMNVYRNINRELIQFDFLAMKGTKIPYEDEINRLGGKVYYILFPRKDVRRLNHPLNHFIKEQGYKVVHYHRTHLGDLDYLWQAKISGVTTRIIHAHSSGYITKLNLISKISEMINKKLLTIVSTELWACSKLAGEWMFNSNDYKLIPNAIDLKKFKYNKEIRDFQRQELNVSDTDALIGHVGSFFDVKNHDFILEMFKRLVLNSKRNYKLVLVGDGPNHERIKEKVINYGLVDYVHFLGTKENVNEIMNSFDIFILPSKFEGLPIVSIEAQANGIPSIISDKITSEVVLSDNITQLSIDSILPWVEKIEELEVKRTNNIESLSEAGYDINVLAQEIETFYLKCALNS